MTSRRIIISACIITGIIHTMADRIVTTRKHLKPSVELQSGIAYTKENQYADTITDHTSKLVRFCGYEKTLRTSRETIFIENLCDSTISSISFTINYLDSDKRQIHQRKIRHKTDIPPRQARRIDIKSWDTQKSYYYIHGDKPRKSATPYDITIFPDTLFITPCIP